MDASLPPATSLGHHHTYCHYCHDTPLSKVACHCEGGMLGYPTGARRRGGTKYRGSGMVLAVLQRHLQGRDPARYILVACLSPPRLPCTASRPRMWPQQPKPPAPLGSCRYWLRCSRERKREGSWCKLPPLQERKRGRVREREREREREQKAKGSACRQNPDLKSEEQTETSFPTMHTVDQNNGSCANRHCEFVDPEDADQPCPACPVCSLVLSHLSRLPSR